MGMLDRDYYQEHWLDKVLGVKPKREPKPWEVPPPDPLPSDRGPIYVNRGGDASRSMYSDPRMHVVYEQRRQHALAWRRIWLRVALVIAGIALGALLWRLRR